MTPSPFVSYAQNGEDVVLHRALAGIEHGRYIDVGANDPTVDSISRPFYEAGWRGITVEPVHAFAERHREQRPDDLLYEVAVTEEPDGTAVLFEIADTGLSTLDRSISDSHIATGRGTVQQVEVPTRRLDDLLAEAGWAGSDIHFLAVDVEGAEEQVFRSIDLRSWRPWIIVAEALEPDTAQPSHESWEPLLLAADYRFALFDGLSRFYVAAEHWDDLGPKLAAPANVLDHFEHHRMVRTLEENGRLRNDALNLTAELDQVREHRDAVITDRNTILADRNQAVSDRDQHADDLNRATGKIAELTAALQQQQADTDELPSRLETAQTDAADWQRKAEEATQELERERARTATKASDRDRERHRAEQAESDLARAQQRLDELTARLTEITGSASWRLTGPLRALRGKAPRGGQPAG